MRRNRHEIVAEGWIHNQDNDKIVRAAGSEDFVLAQEKGYNTYTKVEDADCQAAQDYWVEHGAKWEAVRNGWDNLFAKQADIELKDKVDEKPLFSYMFGLEDSVTTEEVEVVIEKFVKD